MDYMKESKAIVHTGTPNGLGGVGTTLRFEHNCRSYSGEKFVLVPVPSKMI